MKMLKLVLSVATAGLMAAGAALPTSSMAQTAPPQVLRVNIFPGGFNWQSGMPTHYPVRFDAAKLDMDALMAPDILPTFSVASFTAKGAVLEGAALAHTGPLPLIELLNGGDEPSYVAGTENFYAITRYNWSSYYAMAVIDLAEALTREMPNTR